jgi:hypothetical protein
MPICAGDVPLATVTSESSGRVTIRYDPKLIPDLQESQLATARTSSKPVAASTESPVERLMKINEEIIITRANLAREVLLRRLAAWAIILAPTGLFVLIFATYFAWRRYDMQFYNLFIGPILIVVGSVAIAYYYQMTDDRRPATLKLKLALLLERKQIQAADLQLSSRYRRSSYKDEIPEAISKLRKESNMYRRIHNVLQAVIIVGSLATSAVTGVSLDAGQFRLVALFTSLAVGIAAGFTGYYKFRERGFYLQQTADAIEQQYQAVELQIGRYRDLDPDEALAEFVSEVERLRAEQQQRAQNLDQPSEKASEPGAT